MSMKEEIPVWPRQFILRYPIEFNGATITAIHVRRMRIGDIKGMTLSHTIPTNDLLLLASRLTGQVLPVIEAIDAEDAGGIMELVLGFYQSCLSTGATP